MKCPRCSAALGPFNTEEGIVVDTCNACRAVWFDRGELARMVGTREDLPALDAAQEYSLATALPCPRCLGATLAEMPYAVGNAVTIATCPMCQGVLSSLSDLRAMREIAASSRVAQTTSSAFAGAGFGPSGFAQSGFGQSGFGQSGFAQSNTSELARAGEVSIERVAQRFNDLNRLTVKQRRSWLEALTGFEQANRYTVLGNGMGAAFVVQEQSAGFLELLARLFLGPWRPFESYVEDTRRGTIAMKLRRPFRWFLPTLEVCDPEGNLLARIERRWTWFATRYEIFDASGALIGEIHGPFFRPWTFEVMSNGARVALVQKMWSGLIKEAFTDADNFEVTFDPSAPPKWKPLALACAVLIDVAHFERSNK